MEYSQLPQYRCSVVIDFLSRQAVVRTEGVQATQRELDVLARCWKAPPRPHVRPTNDDFEDDRLLGDVLPYYLNAQVGQCGHYLPIELAYLFTTFVMLIPRLIIVTRHLYEGLNDTFKVVGIFQSNVLLNDCQ